MPNHNLELLNSLYQAASMGTSSINAILPKVDNTKLKDELKKQLDTYHTECCDIREYIYSEKAEPKDVSSLAKAYADAGIFVSTMVNSTPSHIAEMMIEGTNMGIIDIRKSMNNSTSASSEIKQKAEKMLKTEEKYIENLKEYL